MSRPQQDQARSVLAAELAFTALTLSAALGFARLFDGWSFLPPLVLAAVGSHLLAAACRRRGWNVGLAALASFAGLAELVTLAFYRSDSFYGIPTVTAWNAMWADLQAAWTSFATAIAPVPASTGYVVAAAIGVWVAAFLADSFAFRALAAVEAILPSGILFVFAAALGADYLRFFLTALWLACAGIAYALHRAMVQEGAGWLAGVRRGTVGSVLRTSALIGGVVLVLALVVAPALPGAGQKALLDTRQQGPGTRETVSPLVDIRGRIVDRSDVEAFSVVSDGKSYWRLTSLDKFDGRIWTSERGYGDAEGELGGGLPKPYTTQITQDVTIDNLDSIWLPAAYSPERIDSPDDVRYDAETSSLVTRRNVVQPGTTYRVVSAVPNLNADELESASAPPPANIAKSYLELPSNYPNNLRVLAQQIVAGATTPYEKAKLLQDYFQTFTYDLSVPAGSSTNAIERFIEARRGYCEQFAGTYAAFARSLGLPARVAVGFTQGELQADGKYHVLGKYAHAWPEVYFTGIGWVPFEPTPSRGLPGAQAYTGLPEAQEGEQPQAPASTLAPPTSAGASAKPTIPDESTPNPLSQLGLPPAAAAPHRAPIGWIVVGILAAILLVGAALWLLVAPRVLRARWDRRRRAAGTGAEKVLVSWRETTDVMARAGAPAQPSETPLEFARRLVDEGDPDASIIQGMADDVTLAAYARDDVDDEVVGRTDDARREVEHRRWGRADWKAKVRWLGDPRPVLRRRFPGDAARPGVDDEPEAERETVGV